MLAGITEILVIVAKGQTNQFRNLLGNGNQLGLKLTYAEQENPRGIAEAFMIGEDFIGEDNVTLILGDNFFYGSGISSSIKTDSGFKGCRIFVYEVGNPEEYGVLEIEKNGKPKTIEEKPKLPKSNLAITGLYLFDSRVSHFVKQVSPSARGELEITSLMNFYLELGEMDFKRFSRGMAWLDTGTPNSLNDASNFVRVIEDRTGNKIACLEEIAWRNGWISNSELIEIGNSFKGNSYGEYLKSLTVNI